MEQRRLSRIHAYFKLVILPYGQSAINGQMINFPFDITEMLEKPTSPNNFFVIRSDKN